MLEEPLKMLEDVAKSLQEQYNKDEKFYKQRQPTAEDNIKSYNKLGNNKDADPVARLVGTASSLSESNFMVNLASHMLTMNSLVRLALAIQISVITIAEEIRQLKQPLMPTNEKDSERLCNLEQELSKLKQMSEQWQPIMDDMKDAMEKTRKYFDVNR